MSFAYAEGTSLNGTLVGNGVGVGVTVGRTAVEVADRGEAGGVTFAPGMDVGVATAVEPPATAGEGADVAVAVEPVHETNTATNAAMAASKANISRRRGRSAEKETTALIRRRGGKDILMWVVIFSLIAITACSGGTPANTIAPYAQSDVLKEGYVISGRPGLLPDVESVQVMSKPPFAGCPPEGDGKDSLQNRQRNRDQEAAYWPVEFGAVADLAWPQEVEKKDRAEWSGEDAAYIARYEGIPVSIIGYLAGVDNPNSGASTCHASSDAKRSWHMFLAPTRIRSAEEAIVVETTPQVRARHPDWTLDAFTRLSDAPARVRVSGWLMLENNDPAQVGVERSTLWEVHPIMLFEVESGGKWVSLEEYTTAG